MEMLTNSSRDKINSISTIIITKMNEYNIDLSVALKDVDKNKKGDRKLFDITVNRNDNDINIDEKEI